MVWSGLLGCKGRGGGPELGRGNVKAVEGRKDSWGGLGGASKQGGGKGEPDTWGFFWWGRSGGC